MIGLDAPLLQQAELDERELLLEAGRLMLAELDLELTA